jgi:hypothetical protein
LFLAIYLFLNASWQELRVLPIRANSAFDGVLIAAFGSGRQLLCVGL